MKITISKSKIKVNKMKIIIILLIFQYSLVGLFAQKTSWNENLTRNKAEKIADKKYHLAKIGDDVTIIANRKVYEGKFRGLTHSQSVKIGDYTLSKWDIPSDNKYLFYKKDLTKDKQKFIDNYIKEAKKSFAEKHGATIKTIHCVIYKNVRLKYRKPHGIYIQHSVGEKFISYSELPDNLKKKYFYNALQEKEYFNKLKIKKDAEYLQKLIKLADERFYQDGKYKKINTVRKKCSKCKGKGKYYKGKNMTLNSVKCSKCKGKGYIERTTTKSIEHKINLKASAVYVTLGQYALAKNDFSKALKYFNIARALNPKSKNQYKKQYAKIYSKKAHSDLISKDYCSAEYNYKQSLSYSDDAEIQKLLDEIKPLADQERMERRIARAELDARLARESASAAEASAKKRAREAATAAKRVSDALESEAREQTRLLEEMQRKLRDIR